MPSVLDKKRTISKNIQDGLDVYATYYMALAHLENNSRDQAERMFGQILETLPEGRPGERNPYYYMFRWGANANLARIQEAKHNDQAAVDYYTRFDPTPQHVGNLLRAREIVWEHPLGPIGGPR
jgi:hypothetical protein